MSVTDFLDVVLPAQGLRCVGSPFEGKIAHSWGDTNAWMAKAITRITDRNLDCYYALAGYGDKTLGRKQTNVVAIRSFWLDIDCGPSKPYLTQKDGAAAVLKLASQTGLPKPWIVASGNGLHAYWPMAEDMEPDTWKATATILKQVCRLAGLAADPARTSDQASVLRPPGSKHFKGDPKPVRLLLEGGVTTLGEFHDTLTDFVEEKGELPEVPHMPKSMGPGLNDDLMGGLNEFPLTFANRIADQCPLMGKMRDTRGQLDQGTWYGLLGVLAACEDGAVAAQEWSNGHPDYSEAETSAKYDQASRFGPTTCQKLSENNSVVCRACPHWTKITSPVSLGREPVALPIPVPPDLTFENEDRDTGGVVLPDNYKWTPKGLAFIPYVEPGDPPVEPVIICDTLFYPLHRIASVDGIYSLELNVVDNRNGSHRQFVLPTALVGAGGATLNTELGSREIVPHPGQGLRLQHYLSRWVDKLKQEAEETQTYEHFGWHDDNFLIGNTMITPVGNKRAIVGGNAAMRAKPLTAQGSFDVWRQVIDTAYNYEGQEAFQYLVLLAFASPLYARFKQYGGITAYAHSEGTGVGKTTAERAALSAWGNWEALQLAEGKVTANALWALMGVYNSLPVLFDELTNQGNSAASEVIYSISSGRARTRLGTDGLLRDNNANWSTIVMASGNNLISEKLALHRANAEAEHARLFEFTITSKSRLSPNQAQELFPKLMDNYGHAGFKYMEYVVQNLEKVEAGLHTIHRAFNNEAGITQGERYWAALNAAVLTALTICRKLDIVQFDPTALKGWIIEQMAVNRGSRNDATVEPTEQLGQMLGDMWQGILLTMGEGAPGAPASVPEGRHPRGQLVGRAILPVDKRERPVLLLAVSAIKEWCNKRGVSAKEMFRAGVAAGWVEGTTRAYQLGRGTVEYASVSSYVRCWVLDPRKMDMDTTAGGNVAQIMRPVGVATSGQ